MKVSTAQRVEQQLEAAIAKLENIKNFPTQGYDVWMRTVTIETHRYVEFAHWLILQDEKCRESFEQRPLHPGWSMQVAAERVSK
jgi:hypothetical protein